MTRNVPIISDDRLARIKPEAIAKKLAAVRNRENHKMLKQLEARPGIVEMLWFVQAMSLQPGGLLRFCEELVDLMPYRLGTPTMRKTKGPFTEGQKKRIWAELPRKFRPAVEHRKPNPIIREDHGAEWDALNARYKKSLAAAVESLSREHLVKVCREEVLKIVPAYLIGLCTHMAIAFDGTPTDEELSESRANYFDSHGEDTEEECTEVRSACVTPLREQLIGWRWCFDDVIGAVFGMMDRHAKEAGNRIAMTEVATRVFQEMDYALQEKVMVRIEGVSGFGKTEAMETWCAMRPGVARLVRVPDGNSMKDFLKAIAEAMGIDCSYGSNAVGLADKVDYVLKHGGLFLVLDECAFLIPRRYSSTSSPVRLEWVRARIVERGLPLVLASTPSKWNTDVARFVKATRYTLEEFFRRNFLTVKLPSSLSEKDMIAAARIHFPELDDDALGYIANEARLSLNYLQAVEAIAKRSRFLASRGKGRISFKIIETAVADVIPGHVIPGAGADSTHTKQQVNSDLNPVLRGIKPETETDFPSCSLRPEVAEASI